MLLVVSLNDFDYCNIPACFIRVEKKSADPLIDLTRYSHSRTFVVVKYCRSTSLAVFFDGYTECVYPNAGCKVVLGMSAGSR